jgi:hypothetical protein
VDRIVVNNTIACVVGPGKHLNLDVNRDREGFALRSRP